MEISIAAEFGALVISLDFEMYWGVRDFHPVDGGAYRENLMGVRAVVPEILDLFSRFGVSATWATVGLLFASSRRELEAFIPNVLPEYEEIALSPYSELMGMAGDDADPIRFAPDLIELIQRAPGQEIGTHTFSHYYCLEPGQTKRAFESDLQSAVAIATKRAVGPIRSLVFPRNQFNPSYIEILSREGITCCRTNAHGWFHREMPGDQYFRPKVRASRLVDSFLPLSGSQVIRWKDLKTVDGVCCLPASHFLRPYVPRLRHLESLKRRRLFADLDLAAKSRGIVHLWWHPENFGRYPRESLRFLRDVLEAFSEHRDRHGMRSLSMLAAATQYQAGMQMSS